MSNIVDNTAHTKTHYNAELRRYYEYLYGIDLIHIGHFNESINMESLTLKDFHAAIRKSAITLIDQFSSSQTTIERVAELGSNTGGIARLICERRPKAIVDCYEIRPEANKTNRMLNEKTGLSHRINVFEKSYFETDAPDGYYDEICSMESCFLCTDRPKLIQEIARILKLSGYYIDAEILEADDVNKKQLQPLYEHYHVANLGSLKQYVNLGRQNHLKLVNWLDYSHQMRLHYEASIHLIKFHASQLKVSTEFINERIAHCQRWVNQIKEGRILWGIMVFQKQDI